MGEVFAGRYELADPIGRGGVGAVWRAWDHRRRRYVAAKVLQQSDAHSLLRFVREQALRIDHPHVLAPASWAADDDKVLFTMDLVAGGSLVHLIGDYGPLPPLFVCTLLDQLLAGLAAVHAEGVVHRDIKPANVLLEATGTARPRLRLSDFGIAMRLGEPRLTETNYVVGTPGYLAPEQMTGADPDFPADLFAVGLVALYLLEGARPDAKALIEHFAAHGTPRAPQSIPDPLWQVVATLLQPDPDARFRTATGARKALASAVELLPEPGPDDELVEVFDQVGPLPTGFGPEGPLRRAPGVTGLATHPGAVAPDAMNTTPPRTGPGAHYAPPSFPGSAPPYPGPGATPHPTGGTLPPHAGGAATPPPPDSGTFPPYPGGGATPPYPGTGGVPHRPTPGAAPRFPATAAPSLPGAWDVPPLPGAGNVPSHPGAGTARPRAGTGAPVPQSGPHTGTPASGPGSAPPDAGTDTGYAHSYRDSDKGAIPPRPATEPVPPQLPRAHPDPTPHSGTWRPPDRTPPLPHPDTTPPQPQPQPPSMSDTGSFHLPPPRTQAAASQPRSASPTPPHTPPAPVELPTPVPVHALPFAPTHVATRHQPTAPMTAMPQHTFAPAGASTDRPPRLARPSQSAPRHRTRRPGPPAKVAVPMLLLALICFAVGFWALARI
ncbi:protein kinase [Streptomyces sp. NPDC005907]|uniref:serine/threonine-protein kinase n=1 Tax=Streptomyces sp. NPDC005907 TaxID=3154571 RepID=UPI0033DD2A36